MFEYKYKIKINMDFKKFEKKAKYYFDILHKDNYHQIMKLLGRKLRTAKISYEDMLNWLIKEYDYRQVGLSIDLVLEYLDNRDNLDELKTWIESH